MKAPFAPALPLLLFDTQSRSMQKVEASDGKAVRIYTCGPTIYNYAHIGNFRTFLFEDLLRRTLQLLGYSVFQVMNLTDVDDKTIQGAVSAQETLFEYTERYATFFFSDLRTLRIQPAEAYPRATHYIPEMISMISKLIENGSAYLSKDKSVYYKISSCKQYGKLSHLETEFLEENRSERVSSCDEYKKEETSDFVLWKAFDPERDGDVSWPSPWGEGRPGWHIECSVMAKELLGETIDLHAGGVDLIFPHHENEIAQSESCNGCLFSNHWAHAEHLLVDGKKMSKSQGNFYTLNMLLEKGFSGEAIRFFLIGTHYRTQLNFTLEGVQSAESAIRRIRECYGRLQRAEVTPYFPSSKEILDSFSLQYQKFVEKLAKDLNINEALSHLFDLVRQINSAINLGQITEEIQEKAIQLFHKMDDILDILHPDSKEEPIPQEVLELIEARKEARAKKLWSESDHLRKELEQRGFIVEDTAQGQKISKKK